MSTTFETGRTRTLIVEGSLYAHFFKVVATQRNEDGHGYARFEWPGLASIVVEYVILYQGQPAPNPPPQGSTHGYHLGATLGAQHQDYYYDTGVLYYESVDFNASCDFTLTGPVREMKRVTETGSYPGGIVDFTPESDLEYFEQWNGNVSLTVGPLPLTPVVMSQELHWPEGYKLNLTASGYRIVALTPPLGTSSTTQINTLAARVVADFADTVTPPIPLDHTEDTRTCARGFWIGRVIRTGRVEIEHLPITIQGVPGPPPKRIPIYEIPQYTATAALNAAPHLDWSLEGRVRQWADAYPQAQVQDLTEGDVLTADAQGNLARAYTARSFQWSIDDDYVNHEDLLTDSLSETMDGYRLESNWIAANEEVANDWRIVLEDDHAFDSFTLRHQATLLLEDFTSLGGWTVTNGSVDLSLNGGLQAAVTADDTRISKAVNHRLTHYRYLRLRLKADAPLTPVRVWLGERYWDVLVEEANTVEEKTLDLCAAHNAASLTDIRGVDDIASLAFDGLTDGITYWFVEMTLVRQVSALATALAAFQDDYRILTVEVDRKISVARGYPGSSLNALINALTDSGEGHGYVLTPAPDAHVYYNNALHAAFLKDVLDQDVGGDVVFQALPRFDRLRIYPGVGDPTQGYGTGGFVARFTKRLRGRVDGLVYIRDLAPPGTLTTRVQAKQGETVRDTQTTDARRYYRTVPLKGGSYTVVRIDENDAPGLSQVVAVVNRKIGRVDDRARVWDKVNRVPINGATVGVQNLEVAWDVERTSTSAGFYALSALMAGTFFLTARAPDFTLRFLDEFIVAESVVLDVDWPLPYAGAVSGTVIDSSTSAPVPEAWVWAVQNEGPYTGFGSALTDEQGAYTIYDLDAVALANPTGAAYDIYVDAYPYSAQMVSGLQVYLPSQAHQVSASQDFDLLPTATIRGTVVDPDDRPLVHLGVAFEQTDGLMMGSGGTVTDEQGQFEIEEVDVPGTYNGSNSVSIVYSEAIPLSLSSPGIITQNFSPPYVESIVGTITDQATGLPINGVLVTAESGGECWNDYTDENGEFFIHDHPPGTFQVYAEAPDYAASSPQVVTVNAGQQASVPFALVPASAGSIRGTVTEGATGDPIAGAEVYARVSTEPDIVCSFGYTESNGVYTLIDLEAGTYDVTVEASGYQAQTQSGIVVTAGTQTDNVNFQL